MLKSFLWASIVSAVWLLSGCAWLASDDKDETADWSADQFYAEAKQELNNGNYTSAIEMFDRLQARFPFGRHAQQAHLEQIYAHYKDGESDLAIASADRFIRTHPRHPFVDYAYYIKGLANFDRDVGALQKMLPSDPTKTDTRSARQAFDDFAELVRRFPESRYADDAKQRMLFLRNNLAFYEIHVADFYLRRQAYVAAANRAKYVLENYASSPATADALAIMTRAYLKLNLPELAADSGRVLAASHPDSPQAAEAQALLAGQSVPRPDSGWKLLDFDWF